MAFKKATKSQTFLRLALLGAAGSGKSFTALRLAHALAEGDPIAAFDTERRSLSKYSGDTNPDGGAFAFDVDDEMPDFDVRRYIKAVKDAEAAGYKVLVIDSLSHAWAGPGGILEFVDAKKGSGNNFAAWRDATPLHNQLVDTILNARMHVIATMRTKMEYVLEDDGKGKKVPRKVGLQPIQRDGVEYEFDVIADMDDSRMTVGKTRCQALKGKAFVEPGRNVADILKAWLSDGEARPEPEAPAPERDPTWEADRPKFCAELGNLGFKYEDIAAWCEANGNPRPSRMGQKNRDRLLTAIAPGGSARPKLDAYLTGAPLNK